MYIDDIKTRTVNKFENLIDLCELKRKKTISLRQSKIPTTRVKI